MIRKSIFIKNMVCPRCVMSVEQILTELKIPFKQVELGEVTVAKLPNAEQKLLLGKKLKAFGFELLESNNSVIIEQIKSFVIKQIHYSKEPLRVNFSTYLSEQLNHRYGYLSRLFSSVEGITIEKFIINKKIEYVKELLFYDELNLSEIAYRLNYSSVAHLSQQFKKETGMTPTQFKKLRKQQ